MAPNKDQGDLPGSVQSTAQLRQTLDAFERRRAERLRVLESYPSLQRSGPAWAVRVVWWGEEDAGVHRDTGRVIELGAGGIHDPIEESLPKPVIVAAGDPPTLQEATSYQPDQEVSQPDDLTRRLGQLLGRKGRRS